MYAFLSEEWMVEARAIRAKYEDQMPDITIPIRINQVITDVPFGEGELKTFVDTSGGQMVLEIGELDEPDAVLTVDYATAKSMIVDQDPTAAMQAFMSGQIKIQGDMMKIMALQAIPRTEASELVAAELKAMTAD
jgi:putative sterol carrier protein